MKEIEGNVYLMGDEVNTDDIVPSKALTIIDIAKMAQYTCENIDPDFIQKVNKLNIIIAGENFGCGSSREEAVRVFKYFGIQAIIAKSFARIYFRNLINQGIPAITLDWNHGDFSEGDHLKITLESGKLLNLTKNKIKQFEKLPEFILDILEQKGILNKLKNSL